MDMKLVDSEIKVMDVLWKEGDSMAKHVADVMKERYGWNVNTTYTLLKRCIKKGAVERTDPNFVCHALIKQEQVQAQETDELLHKVFDGSVDKLFASLLGRRNLTAEQVEKLKELRLDVPQATLLAYELQKKGFPLRDGILSNEELVEELCQLKSKM